jgi:uncharacterized protein YdaU (DUF1376 family)
MKSKPKWYKLNPAEFLADKNVERMSMEEFGLYNYLLMRGWLDGGIPASLDEIACYSMLRGITRRHLERLWEKVSPCWIPASDGQTLVNPRQEAERATVGEYSEAKSRAGKASAAKRLQCKPNTPATPVKHVLDFCSTGPFNNQDTDNRPTPQTEDATGAVTPSLLAAFESLAEKYPNCTDKDFAFQIWMTYCDQRVITEANVAEVFDGLTRWLDSELWSREGGRYIQSFARWLHAKKWKDRPNPSPDAKAARRATKRSRDGYDPNAEWIAPWKDEEGKILPEFIEDEIA